MTMFIINFKGLLGRQRWQRLDKPLYMYKNTNIMLIVCVQYIVTELSGHGGS